MGKIIKKTIPIWLNALFWFSIFLIFNFRYENPDDIFISRFIANDGINPFSYQWVSYVYKYFIDLLPIPIWSLFSLILIFISSTLILNDVLKSEQKILKIINSSILFLVLIDLLFQCQFTKTATFIAITGACNLIYQNTKSRKILGIILLFIGVSIRPTVLYLIAPICGIMIFIHYLKDKNIKKFIKNVSIYFLIFITMFSISKINSTTYLNKHLEYQNYNIARSNILDDLKVDFDKSNQLTTISVNDYNMLDNWLIADTDYFNTEKLQNVGEEIKTLKTQNNFKNNFLENTTTLLFNYLGIIIILLSMLLFFNKSKSYVLCPLLIIALSILFSCMSRFPYRILFSILLSISIILLYETKSLDKILIKKKILTALYGVVVIIATMNFIFPVFALNTYYPDSINSTYKYIQENEKDIFLISSEIEFKEYLCYKMLDKDTQDEINNIIYYSWQTNSEYYKTKLNELNIDNAIKNLYQKENYYYVAFNHDNTPQLIQTYLKENYDIDVNINIYKTIKNINIIKFE